MERTVVVARNGQEKLRIPATITANGEVYGPQMTPVLDGVRVAAAGINSTELLARAKARKLTADDLAYIAHYGDNGGGLVIMDAGEWDKAEYERKAAERDAKARRMADLFPGLDELRAALADEDRHHRQFERMMEDEDNDGARPPEPVKVHYADIAPRYPAAVAYLVAEGYSMAHNYAKSGAGDRAVRRLEAGEEYGQVIADMKAEWDKHVNAHVWD